MGLNVFFRTLFVCEMSPVECIFVDLQGFMVDERFKVKEFAALKRGRELTHYIFGPSIPWSLLENADRSRASWLMHNHHGLKWNDGEVEYKRAKSLIKQALRIDSDEVSVLFNKTHVLVLCVSGYPDIRERAGENEMARGNDGRDSDRKHGRHLR